MSITEEKRLDLANSAREALGQVNGDTLMELLPPVGWVDVATKHDLEQLRILIGKDFEMLRLEINGRFAGTDHAINSLRLGMDGELRSFRGELALQISELRNELNRSLLRFFIGTTTTTILTLLSGMYLTR